MANEAISNAKLTFLKNVLICLYINGVHFRVNLNTRLTTNVTSREWPAGRGRGGSCRAAKSANQTYRIVPGVELPVEALGSATPVRSEPASYRGGCHYCQATMANRQVCPTSLGTGCALGAAAI